jgi:RNA polymerase sigma factor (sigma-70 family)
MNQPPSDNELLSLLVQGDHHAFETIYRRYVQELYRYARQKIEVPEDCEEMIQDVFESLWLRHEELNIRSLRHYLFNSVRYMIIRYIAHRNVKQKYAQHYRAFTQHYIPPPQAELDERSDVLRIPPLEGELDERSNVQRIPPLEGEVDERSDVRRGLLTALSGLPDRCRQAMHLRITENLSNKEIAERMQISKATVELYISKALTHLRSQKHLLPRS